MKAKQENPCGPRRAANACRRPSATARSCRARATPPPNESRWKSSPRTAAPPHDSSCLPREPPKPPACANPPTRAPSRAASNSAHPKESHFQRVGNTAQFNPAGNRSNGGYAQFLLTGERTLIKLPKTLAPKDVAPYTDAGLTAYRAAKKASRHLLPGEYAVIIGAGGLGHIGIQVLSALCAAEIIVVDRAEKSLALAKDCGSNHMLKADGGEVELGPGADKRQRRRGGDRLCRRGCRSRQRPGDELETAGVITSSATAERSRFRRSI